MNGPPIVQFFQEKFHSIRFKLISSLIGVSLFIGLISVLVGGNLLYRSVIKEANNRIQQDLNVARVIYDYRIDEIRLALTVTASAYHGGKVATSTKMQEALDELNNQLHFDFLGIVDATGKVMYQPGQRESGSRSPASTNPLVLATLKQRKQISGTVVMDLDQLQFENPFLDTQVNIATSEGDNTTALVIGAAVPLFAENELTGAIYGGFLLNRDTSIVDKIGETVFKNEIYKGKNVGTSTIFSKDLRIATSVKDPSGNRALGTQASPEVAKHVLDGGEKWTNRARVLNDWYITAYEPIENIDNKRVGMLYVGVLEDKYSDIRKKGIYVFTGITVAGVFVAIVLGWLFTGRIMRPVTYLIRGSTEISKGNFSPDIGPISKDDVGRLQKEFLIMTDALKERERRQKVEGETRLLQSEKQASLGKLAAGVAHEINNPLTAVLTFTHLILKKKDLSDDIRSDLEIVATQTERVRKIVKSLLDFSRQTTINPESLNINNLIEDSIGLMQNQALIKGVELTFTGAADLPALKVDRNQFQSVLINMIINALDATPPGGRIAIQTMQVETTTSNGVEITITDTGSGILPEHMDQLFDPFFTTKEVGQGTGLGLAVTAGIIEHHGGTIKVQSQPDKGTVFTIWIPCQGSAETSDFDTEPGDRL